MKNHLKNLHKDHQNSISLWIKVLRVFGINIFDDNPGFLSYALSTVVVLGVYYFVAKSVVISLFRKHSIIYILLAVYGFSIPFQLLVKFFVIKLFGKKIARIILSVDKMWPRSNVRPRSTLSRRMDTFFKAHFYVITLGVLITEATLTVIQTIIKGHILFSDWYILYVTILGTVNRAFIHSFLFLLGACAINTSELFLQLQTDLMNVCGERSAGLREDELEHSLKDLIRFHQKIFKITDSLKDICNMSVLEVLATGPVLGMHALTIFFAIMAHDINTIDLACLLGLRIATLYSLHLPAQAVFDTSQGVADAAYSCLWYTKSRKIKALLAMIIVRSQQPVHFTVLNIYVLNMKRIALMLSEAWSFATFLATTCDVNVFN